MKSTSSGQLEAADAPKHSNFVAILAPLLGDWHVEGDVEASEHGPAARWRSTERCEWLPGERFLVNRWDAKVGDRPFQGMAVFGHDAETGYFATFYDDAGHHPTYLVTIEGSTWTLTGEAQRATYEFSDGGRAMRICWETRGDQGWQKLCELRATRARPH